MITQVSGFNTKSVTGGLRQRPQTMSFTHNSNAPLQYSQIQKNDSFQNSQQSNKSPVWTGTSIVLGSVLFMIAYFLISGAKRG